MIFKYRKAYAVQLQVNDIIKYSGDHYDISLVEKMPDNKMRIRGISFFNDSILDKQFDRKYELDVFQIHSKGIF